MYSVIRLFQLSVMVARCGDFIEEKLMNAIIYNFVSEFLISNTTL